MLFSITMTHAGLTCAIFAFLLWSLPGAVGMYGLSLGVQKMPDRLPPIVYALLSGMNASTVGIIALAAVQVCNPPSTDQTYLQDVDHTYSWQRRRSRISSQGF
jgi:chromate transport protein ChrA